MALIFLLGFVGFGVGAGVGGGGIFEGLFGGKEGTNGASFGEQVEKAKKRARLHPHEAAAWAALSETQLHQASEGQYYDQASEQYTAKGKELIGEVAQSWSTYLSLEPRNPNVGLAKQMVSRVFSETALNQPQAGVQALQIIVAAEPRSSSWYAQLAIFAYKAHDVREGDLAAQRAVSLEPASGRATLKQKLAEEKKKAAAASAGASSSTSTVTVPAKR